MPRGACDHEVSKTKTYEERGEKEKLVIKNVTVTTRCGCKKFENRYGAATCLECGHDQYYHLFY